ncbi:MAG: hypothetical protein JRI80_18725 [Deltaproteobacteria bacterium]|nr:hypothetical protein [Deltaproteobacteria bacterium]
MSDSDPCTRRGHKARNRTCTAVWIPLAVIVFLVASQMKAFAVGDEMISEGRSDSMTETRLTLSTAARTGAVSRDSVGYSGLYCMYTFLKLTGTALDFRDLLKPEYISSRYGSTIADLERIANDYGIYVASAKNMTVESLLNSHCPTILHVRTRSAGIDHYCLFMGMQGGKALVLFPPTDLRSYVFANVDWMRNGNLMA